MSYQIGEDIIGKVTQVKPYALFLSFEDGSNGLLHISELSDNYIRDIEKFGTVGDELKVRVLSIDKTNGFLRVSFKAIPDKEKFTTHQSQTHAAPVINDSDFSELKEKLPMWIEETLKKAKGENND